MTSPEVEFARHDEFAYQGVYDVFPYRRLIPILRYMVESAPDNKRRREEINFIKTSLDEFYIRYKEEEF